MGNHIFEVSVTKNLPKVMKDCNPQIEEGQQNHSKVNKNKSIPRQITVKSQKTKRKVILEINGRWEER